MLYLYHLFPPAGNTEYLRQDNMNARATTSSDTIQLTFCCIYEKSAAHVTPRFYHLPRVA